MLQVDRYIERWIKDYSKFSMHAFDADAKKARHEAQFPVDLQECFKMGERLSK